MAKVITKIGISPPTLLVRLSSSLRSDEGARRSPAPRETASQPNFVIASDPAMAGGRGNLIDSHFYEIASVVPLPRNDVARQSPRGEGREGAHSALTKGQTMCNKIFRLFSSEPLGEKR